VSSTRLPLLTGWEQQNYRGRRVSLVAGPAAALAGGLLVRLPRAWPLAAIVAAPGRYDDLVSQRASQRTDKGLLGHLRALRAGRVTSGCVKAAVLPTAGLLAVLPSRGQSQAQPARMVTGALLVAGCANAVNLLDVVPGRALKSVLGVLAVTTLAGKGAGRAAAARLGLVVAVALPLDLAERTMLGDCGANSLGALLGLCLAADPRGRVRIVSLACSVTLIVVAERVSLSALVARQPVLARIDGCGRQP